MHTHPAKNLLVQVVERIGIAKFLGGVAVALVVGTLAIATAWSTKADAEDLDAHITWAHEARAAVDKRVGELEQRAAKLEVLEQATLDQVVYMRDRLDGFLVARGSPPSEPAPPLPSPRAVPTSTAAPP